MPNQQPATFYSLAHKHYAADEFSRGVALALGIIAPLSPFDVADSISATQAKR